MSGWTDWAQIQLAIDHDTAVRLETVLYSVPGVVFEFTIGGRDVQLELGREPPSEDVRKLRELRGFATFQPSYVFAPYVPLDPIPLSIEVLEDT